MISNAASAEAPSESATEHLTSTVESKSSSKWLGLALFCAPYPILQIAKKQIKEQNLAKNVRTEVQTHIRLKHPNIVELFTTFEDRSYVYLVCALFLFGSFL